MSTLSTPAHASTRRALSGVELLTAMLCIPSVSGDEAQLASFLAGDLYAAGFDTRVDAAGNLVASRGEGCEHVALVGHLDTVPGRIAVRQDGDSLYGRGAVDAKGPLAAALTAVMRQPRDGGTRFTVIGAVGEETTSRGARHLAETMAAPDQLVILEPSGWQGVTIAYKGSVRLQWSLQVPAAHSAGPSMSAADRAFAFVNALHQLAAARSGDAGRFDRVDVRVLRCDAGSDGLRDRAHVDIGVRVPLGCDLDELLCDVRALAGEGSLDVTSAEPPVRTDRASRLARRFVQAIRAQGGSPRFKLKTGTSDLNVLVPAWRCPAIAYGPGDSMLDHAPDEHIEISEFERSVDVLDRVLRAL